MSEIYKIDLPSKYGFKIELIVFEDESMNLILDDSYGHIVIVDDIHTTGNISFSE